MRLVREPARADGLKSFHWNPESGSLDVRALPQLAGVINLCGESLTGGRWNSLRKEKIASSRVRSAALLAEKIAGLASPPPVFVCASAVGFYGSRGDEELDESSAPGQGFLAEVCRAWEDAARGASQAGTRVVAARFGVVLSPAGGALKIMLPPFRLGVGGPVGDGSQYVSWVSIDDAVAALIFILERAALEGPVNITSPAAVTNREMAETLAEALGRRARFHVPRAAARLALGEMADEMFFASCRARPAKLLAAGFEFKHADLKAALRDLLS